MLFSSFPLRPGGYVRFNVPARTYELAFPSSGVHYLAGRNRKRFRQRRATRAGTSFATNLRSVRRTGEGVFRTELPMISLFPLEEGRVRGNSFRSGALEFIPANYDQLWKVGRAWHGQIYLRQALPFRNEFRAHVSEKDLKLM